jgi:hypothetical protein
MRILVSCLQSLKYHALPPYQFWRQHFIHGCEEAGIECLEVPGVDWAEGLVYPPGDELKEWRARTWETVIAFARQAHRQRPINFFLGYLYPKQVEVAAIEDLQGMGIPAVNFFCDNLREFSQVPVAYRSFALHWVPEFEALPMYRLAKLPYLHAPMPCWVPPAFRCFSASETEAPTFIGSADLLRRDLVGHALRAGADFIARGRGWIGDLDDPQFGVLKPQSISKLVSNQVALVQTYGISGLLHKVGNRLRPVRPPPIPNSNIRDAILGQEEYFRVTREAMITIGINRVPTQRKSNRHPLAYSRLRDIEAPMLGACYLTEWTQGLEALYDLGHEIETYRTPEELTEKLDALRQDPQRRSRMRNRAQRRALRDHSVSRSVARIAEQLGLSVNS